MKNFNIVLWFIGILSYSPISAQIVNEGILKISANTTVFFGEEYTNQANGSHQNDGDLYLNHNFINNGTTFASTGTTYFNSQNLDTQEISGSSNSIHFYNLVVNLTLESKKGLLVANHFGLNVTNALSLISGDLRLVGDAQLLQTHVGSNANPVGTGKLLLDQQGNSSPYAFNYWSSPIHDSGGFTIGGGLFDGTDAGINPFTPQHVTCISNGTLNGEPSVVDVEGNVTTPLSINKRWLYKYYEPASWKQIEDSTNLLPGQGFLMKGTNTTSSEQNYVFKGDPNNGTYQLAVSPGESILLGNPYPSAIDANLFITDNIALFEGTLYFWVDGGANTHVRSSYLGGYAMRNLVTGVAPSVADEIIQGLGNSSAITPPSQYIDVGQGFFIDTTDNGNIIFDNDQRIIKTVNSGSVQFYKQTNSNSIIKLGYEAPSGFHRQIALGFMSNCNANKDYNPGYDAKMIDPRSDELYFIINNQPDDKYSIQGVGTFDEGIEIPIGLIVGEEGTHNIMLDGIENFNQPIYIHDKLSDLYYDLQHSNCQLILPAGSYLDRFEISFQSQTLNNEQLKKDNTQILLTKDRLTIYNPDHLRIESIQIHNLLGQLITTIKGSLNDTLITMPFEYETGTYIIKVLTSSKTITYKRINY